MEVTLLTYPFGFMKGVHKQSVSPTLAQVQAKYIREINTFSRNSHLY